MRPYWFIPSLLGLLLAALPAHAGGRLLKWQFDQDERQLEIVTETGVSPRAHLVPDPTRVVIDLPNTQLGQSNSEKKLGKRFRRLRAGQFDQYTARIVIELGSKYRVSPQSVRIKGVAPNRWLVTLPKPSRYSFQDRRALALRRRPVPIVVPSPRNSSLASTPSDSATPPPSSRLSPSPWRSSGKRATVVIDPGHGGRDPGAIGIGGLKEVQVVLPISQEVERILRAKGVNVIMTRSTDQYVSLQGRVGIAERAQGKVFVSIHANAISLSRPDVNGVETFYYQTGKSLAQSIHSSIHRRIRIGDRGVRQARFYVLRKSSMPASLVEVGFVTGSLDSPRLRQPPFRQQMADAIAEGILNHLGI
ncbi:MAG: N-acetylmuramoyl-L-alanine amidase [Cyanobacteria bacterium P01_A01_bin.17]